MQDIPFFSPKLNIFMGGFSLKVTWGWMLQRRWRKSTKFNPFQAKQKTISFSLWNKILILVNASKKCYRKIKIKLLNFIFNPNTKMYTLGLYVCLFVWHFIISNSNNKGLKINQLKNNYIINRKERDVTHFMYNINGNILVNFKLSNLFSLMKIFSDFHFRTPLLF